MKKLSLTLCVVTMLVSLTCSVSAVYILPANKDTNSSFQLVRLALYDPVTVQQEVVISDEEEPIAAPPPFDDVAIDHQYKDAIAKAKEAGYVNGTGDGNFYPDRSATAYEISVMLGNIFPEYDCMTDKVVLPYGYMKSPGLHLNHAQLSALVLRAAGITPYTVKLWNEESDSNIETDSYNAAYQDGIMACGHGAYDEVSRGETINFMLVVKEQGITLDFPEWYQQFSITEDNMSELEEALFDLKKIPESVLQLFREKEWTIHLGREYIQDWSERNGGFSAAALTSYKNKTCYIGADYAIPHEIGHFLEYQLRKGTDRVTFPEKERNASEKVLGKYATSNDLEYFAEYFAYWIKNSSNAKKMNLLKDKTPETYAYFTALEANNWARPW